MSPTEPIRTEYELSVGEVTTKHENAEKLALALLAIDGRKKARIFVLETTRREITQEPEPQ